MMNAPTLTKTERTTAPPRSWTVMLDNGAIHVPPWVVDLESFRHWAKTEEFPETFPDVCFYAGEIWIDMSGEQLFTHNQIKLEFYQVLGPQVKKARQGRFFPDGALLTNVEADLSCKPDGTFVKKESFENGRVRLVEGAKHGFVELEGSPDLVLEIVSDSSETKDTETLIELYHKAGIREYWLVDARDELKFEIYRHTKKGYSPARMTDGWMKSKVFGKLFRLTKGTDELGQPEFTLSMK